MARTTIIRYAKYCGSAWKVKNKTVMHGFRLHKSDGVGVDSNKSKDNLYFVWQKDNNFKQVSHEQRKQVVSRFNSLYQELKTVQDNNDKLIPFEQKYLKHAWVFEVVKTYSPKLFQEWDLAEVKEVSENPPPDYLETKFKIKSEGFYLEKVKNKTKLNDLVKKLIAEESDLLKQKLKTTKGMIGATCHLDERNIHLHMYFMPVSLKDRIETSKFLHGREDFRARQLSFWEWSRKNVDGTIEKYRPKTESNAKHKSFKQWHSEQKNVLNLEILNLTQQLTTTTELFNQLQQQRNEILGYLKLDLKSTEKMQLQNLILIIENVQNLKLKVALGNNPIQKQEYQDLLNKWEKRKQELTLFLMPLLQKAQLMIREQKEQ